MTRIMKIVPASRLVTDASLESPSKPPSIDRSRAIMPAGGVVAEGASIAATAEIPLGFRKGAATIGPINDSLRFGWAPGRPAETLFQIDIEFVGAVAADQCQFLRSAFGVRVRWQAI